MLLGRFPAMIVTKWLLGLSAILGDGVNDGISFFLRAQDATDQGNTRRWETGLHGGSRPLGSLVRSCRQLAESVACRQDSLERERTEGTGPASIALILWQRGIFTSTPDGDRVAGIEIHICGVKRHDV
jgi:hypothetical protein